MKTEIKLATKKDFKALAEIYTEEFSKSPFNEPWTLKKAIAKLEIFSNYCDLYTITSDNNIVGFIAVNPNQWCPGEVLFGEEMAIKLEYQRKGLATEVFKQIFQIYKKKGFKTYLGIVNKNSKSFGLHSKLGLLESRDNILIEGTIK